MNHCVRPSFLLNRGHLHSPKAAAAAAAAAAALFHSTPVLARRRNSQFRFNSFATRFRSKEAKRTLFRDAHMYLEHFLEGSWDLQNGYGYPQRVSSDYMSWFEKQYFGKGRKKNFYTQSFQWESHPRRRTNIFPELFWDDTDDDETTIFGSSSERSSQGFNWSIRFENFGRGSSRHRQRRAQERVSWEWKDEMDDEYFWKGGSGNKRTTHDWKNASQNGYDNLSKSVMASDRLILGLTATGPLKLEEVKNAYRACALRWHPDRHQGSSKVAAEEKFKDCSAAYKSICDELVCT